MIAEIIGSDPQNEENRINAARFYLAQGQAENAEKLLKEGIKAVPASFQLRFALAEIYLSGNQPDAAEKTLNECLGLESEPDSPNLQQAKTMLASTLLAKGEVAAAETPPWTRSSRPIPRTWMPTSSRAGCTCCAGTGRRR